jgi:hypothetical protein
MHLCPNDAYVKVSVLPCFGAAVLCYVFVQEGEKLYTWEASCMQIEL